MRQRWLEEGGQVVISVASNSVICEAGKQKLGSNKRKRLKCQLTSPSRSCVSLVSRSASFPK